MHLYELNRVEIRTYLTNQVLPPDSPRLPDHYCEATLSMERRLPGFHQSDPYGHIYLEHLIQSTVSRDSKVQEYLNKPLCRNSSLDACSQVTKPIQPFPYPYLKWDKDVLKRASLGRLHTYSTQLTSDWTNS